MNNINTISEELKPQIHTKLSPDIYEGIYHSNTINKSPAEIFAFCQNEANLDKVFTDLPDKIKNFLDLELVQAKATSSISNGAYRIEWRNKKGAEKRGSLTFALTPNTGARGTVVIANAIFDGYEMDNEEPSDLINVFLKRIKALSETGQIATTTGQPNGNDEKEMNEKLKH